MASKKISLIIPVYNEGKNLAWHYDLIKKFLDQEKLMYELIYVNDGSVDNSQAVIESLAAKDEYIKFLSLSRNFGKEAATTAGLQNCKGDAAIMIDADGQHPVELIREFLLRWYEGYEVVIGVRVNNKNEGAVKKYGSQLFYKILSSVAGGNTMPGSTDFRLIDRKVIDEFNRLTEHNRITRGLIDWLGFKRIYVKFDANERHDGDAAYSYRKLLKLAIHAFVSHSTKPLQLTGIIGGLVMLLSAFSTVFLLLEKYIFSDPMHLAVTGTAILALFLSFLIGLVLICQWLLALYIESIHAETQNRPLYVIENRKP